MMPHDSPMSMTLVRLSDAKDHGEIRTRSPPYRGNKCKWGGLILATFDGKRAIILLENGTR